MTTVARGNLMGITALIMWSTMIGLIRSITETFGVAEGTALIYSVGAIAIFLKNGPPPVRKMPRVYLFGVGFIFVAYEIIFSQAVGRAESAAQTLEIGMLNYLWPSMTVVFSIWINKTRLRWWVWPGTALSVVGLYLCVAANGNVNLAGFISNILGNPLPYALGIIAGVTWGIYSNLSFRYSAGYNGIPVFFAAIAVILWLSFFAHGGRFDVFSGGYAWTAYAELAVIGAIMGISYSLWESGIHAGNFVLLAVCSYFNPAMSMLFASLWLNTIPPTGFWTGVVLVVAGSLICWQASIKIKQVAPVGKG